MTKEERILCALSREEPDRVPLYDLVSNFAVLSRYAGTEVTVENSVRTVPTAINAALDMTRPWLPSALTRRVDERGFVHEYKDPFTEWVVDRPFKNEDETATFIESDIERLRNWKAPQGSVYGDQLQQRRELKALYGGTVLPASMAGEALSEAYILLGLDRFVVIESQNHDLMERWCAALHHQVMESISSDSECRSLSPVAWIFNDIAYKGRLMFSPEYLRQHDVFRHIAEMCSLYHSLGLKVIYHSDGYIRPVIPDLIDAGVDAIAPVEIVSGLDLRELKDLFGKKIAFVGGLDMGILCFGDAEQVRRTTIETLRIMAPGGGFILGSDSEELIDAIPVENVLAMHETAKESGKYPFHASYRV